MSQVTVPLQAPESNDHAWQHQNILFERSLASKLSNTPKMIFISHLQPLQISNKAKFHAFFEKFSHWKLKPAPTQDKFLDFLQNEFSHSTCFQKAFFILWLSSSISLSRGLAFRFLPLVPSTFQFPASFDGWSLSRLGASFVPRKARFLDSQKPIELRQYYSVQEKMFFEGITTPKVCIKIELSRREWVSVLLLVIFDDFGMIWIPNDQLDCFQQILYISTT